jgi:hypothetical protein
VISSAWNTCCSEPRAIDRWQFKIRILRRVVRGWAANEVASLNKTKRALAEEYNMLDERAENDGLSAQELERLKEVADKLSKIWALEEIKIRQRSRDRDILEGDRNTTYFQAIANQSSRKKMVYSLMGPRGVVEDQTGMMRVAVDFYKNLFAVENKEDIFLSSDFWETEDLVTQAENDTLDAPFSIEEIKEAVFSSYSDGAPGPDGLSFMFYQKFWEILKEDLVSLFEDFYKGDLDLYRLNCAMLTLIPKVEEVKEMKQFRPISLINCSFKIFLKVLTNRLGKISDRLMTSNQCAFIKGRYILESVVVAHELVHSLHKKKDPGLIIKLDYEKAYDRISWDFLFEVLSSRGFSERWVNWIKCLMKGGSVGVILNGEESSYFKPGKGLRQGDPISPLLFNLVGDVLTKMWQKGAGNDLIRGLLPKFKEGGIVSLQYADDTIVFSNPSEQCLRNLKCSLI